MRLPIVDNVSAGEPVREATECGAPLQPACEARTEYEAALQRKINQQAVKIHMQSEDLIWASDFAKECENRVRAMDPTIDILGIKVPLFTPSVDASVHYICS